MSAAHNGTRSDLICDISKTGRLLELGCDPFTRAPEQKAVSTQTEGNLGWAKAAELAARAGEAAGDLLGGGTGGTGGGGGVEKAMVARPASSSPSPASQVLRLVVGLLGMEVHERPSSWAEVWLTFHDVQRTNLGLSPNKDNGRSVVFEGLEHNAEQNRWQAKVLQHLRDLVNPQAKQRSTSAVQSSASGAGTGEEEQQSLSHDWGPDFPEHLDLAEFALGRIAHAVGVLQDPGKHDRPMVLREYTEAMVAEVCADLRQWLEQLAVVVSLYHVHLLDLEGERRRLAELLAAREATFAEAQRERESLKMRHDHLQAQWKEERTKQRAEALLGIKLQGVDAKIYSQRQVDDMQRDWEKEHLEPLFIDIRDLRIEKDGLIDKLADRDKQIRDLRRGGRGGGGEDVCFQKATMGLICAALNASAERVTDEPLSMALVELAESVNKGGDNLKDILQMISRLPHPERPVSPTDGGDRSLSPTARSDNPAVQCLRAVTKELGVLEGELRDCPIASGADKLSFLVAWARDTVNIVKSAVDAWPFPEDAPRLRWVAPPKWDLGSLNKKAGIRTVGVMTGRELMDDLTDRMRAALDAEFKEKLRINRAEFERRLQEAMAMVEIEKAKADEALEKMREASNQSGDAMAELRRKMLRMQKLLREKGLGEEVEGALHGAGLSDFVQGRDVFERLYRDALDRMRKHAETQQRVLEEQSKQFLGTVGSIFAPPVKAPENYYYIEPDSQRAPAGREHAGHLQEQLQGVYRSEGQGLYLTEPSPTSVARGPSLGDVRVLPPQKVPQQSPAAALDISPLCSAAVDKPDRASHAHKPSLQVRALYSPLREAGDAGLSVGVPLTQDTSQPSAITRAAARVREASQGNGSVSATVAAALAAARIAKPHQLIRGTPDGGVLPPLECRGKVVLSPRRDGAGNGAGSPPEEERAPRSQSVGSRAPPLRELRPVREDSVVNLLQIGSCRAPSAGSLLLPPDMHVRPPEKPRTKAPGRGSAVAPPPGAPYAGAGGTQAGRAGGLQRNTGGALSMPHLGPPRLLVQSVGSAY